MWKSYEIVQEVEKIVFEKGISEEEAYEEFRTGKTKQERLQEQADKLVLAESEVTSEFLNQLGDEEYEEAMFDEYLESLP